ncbi:MAG: CocE/NonD family hydrolase [Rhodospirillales bacterium]|jgi:hypothetical protein|nr:CocE/NonD family hydrolase [Rhodospirillales bacterium]
MFTRHWSTSAREFDVVHQRDVSIPVSDGITIDADIIRPEGSPPCPAILSLHAYDKADQMTDLTPVAFSHARGHMEAGDSQFFARRGYAQVIANVRGTGASGGYYDERGPRTIEDACEVIEWLAEQAWCDGNVGMFGMSYFAIVSNLVAARNPPHLKAIFAPFGWTDMYRDRFYHGGILNHAFMKMWLPTVSNLRAKSILREMIGEERFDQLIEEAKSDPDIMAVPFLQYALQNPAEEDATLVADILAQPFESQFFHDRSVDYDTKPKVPGYFGACWGVYGLHLPGAFRSWQNWAGPKRMTIGPPIYLDRPIYQYQYESLRWFDHWLKGLDTGLDDEPPIKIFIDNTGDWRSADTWPLPETRWTPFYLHNDNMLSEHELFAADTCSEFDDSPENHGAVEFWTPPMVENTELCGPISLTIHASTSDDEVLWFASLLHRNREGKERLLSRGWLRGSQRETDPELSKPWQPHHTHKARTPLEPGEIYQFDLAIGPYAILVKPGEQLGLRIKCADDEVPEDTLQIINMGHLWRHKAAHITIQHNRDHPSHINLPITSGNVIGTYYSGGVLPKP